MNKNITLIETNITGDTRRNVDFNEAVNILKQVPTERKWAVVKSLDTGERTIVSSTRVYESVADQITSLLEQGGEIHIMGVLNGGGCLGDMREDLDDAQKTLQDIVYHVSDLEDMISEISGTLEDLRARADEEEQEDTWDDCSTTDSEEQGFGFVSIRNENEEPMTYSTTLCNNETDPTLTVDTDNKTIRINANNGRNTVIEAIVAAVTACRNLGYLYSGNAIVKDDTEE